MGSLERVESFLSKSGCSYDVRVLTESTRSSALAARALGCAVAEIAKSVVFVGKGTTVVITSGDRRVSVAKLTKKVGEARVATPDEVRQRTGYPIGGVPPFPHGDDVVVMADVSLTRFRRVWAAAGAPNAVFLIDPADIIRLLGEGPFDLCD